MLQPASQEALRHRIVPQAELLPQHASQAVAHRHPHALLHRHRRASQEALRHRPGNHPAIFHLLCPNQVHPDQERMLLHSNPGQIHRVQPNHGVEVAVLIEVVVPVALAEAADTAAAAVAEAVAVTAAVAAAEVVAVAVAAEVAVAAAEDVRIAYSPEISDTLISLRLTYFPSLFTNRLI